MSDIVSRVTELARKPGNIEFLIEVINEFSVLFPKIIGSSKNKKICQSCFLFSQLLMDNLGSININEILFRNILMELTVVGSLCMDLPKSPNYHIIVINGFNFFGSDQCITEFISNLSTFFLFSNFKNSLFFSPSFEQIINGLILKHESIAFSRAFLSVFTKLVVFDEKVSLKSYSPLQSLIKQFNQSLLLIETGEVCALLITRLIKKLSVFTRDIIDDFFLKGSFDLIWRFLHKNKSPTIKDFVYDLLSSYDHHDKELPNKYLSLLLNENSNIEHILNGFYSFIVDYKFSMTKIENNFDLISMFSLNNLIISNNKKFLYPIFCVLIQKEYSKIINVLIAIIQSIESDDKQIESIFVKILEKNEIMELDTNCEKFSEVIMTMNSNHIGNIISSNPSFSRFYLCLFAVSHSLVFSLYEFTLGLVRFIPDSHFYSFFLSQALSSMGSIITLECFVSLIESNFEIAYFDSIAFLIESKPERLRELLSINGFKKIDKIIKANHISETYKLRFLLALTSSKVFNEDLNQTIIDLEPENFLFQLETTTYQYYFDSMSVYHPIFLPSLIPFAQFPVSSFSQYDLYNIARFSIPVYYRTKKECPYLVKVSNRFVLAEYIEYFLKPNERWSCNFDPDDDHCSVYEFFPVYKEANMRIEQPFFSICFWFKFYGTNNRNLIIAESESMVISIEGLALNMIWGKIQQKATVRPNKWIFVMIETQQWIFGQSMCVIKINDHDYPFPELYSFKYFRFGSETLSKNASWVLSPSIRINENIFKDQSLSNELFKKGHRDTSIVKPFTTVSTGFKSLIIGKGIVFVPYCSITSLMSSPKCFLSTTSQICESKKVFLFQDFVKSMLSVSCCISQQFSSFWVILLKIFFDQFYIFDKELIEHFLDHLLFEMDESKGLNILKRFLMDSRLWAIISQAQSLYIFDYLISHIPKNYAKRMNDVFFSLVNLIISISDFYIKRNVLRFLVWFSLEYPDNGDLSTVYTSLFIELHNFNDNPFGLKIHLYEYVIEFSNTDNLKAISNHSFIRLNSTSSPELFSSLIDLLIDLHSKGLSLFFDDEILFQLVDQTLLWKGVISLIVNNNLINKVEYEVFEARPKNKVFISLLMKLFVFSLTVIFEELRNKGMILTSIYEICKWISSGIMKWISEYPDQFKSEGLINMISTYLWFIPCVFNDIFQASFNCEDIAEEFYSKMNEDIFDMRSSLLKNCIKDSTSAFSIHQSIQDYIKKINSGENYIYQSLSSADVFSDTGIAKLLANLSVLYINEFEQFHLFLSIINQSSNRIENYSHLMKEEFLLSLVSFLRNMTSLITSDIIQLIMQFSIQILEDLNFFGFKQCFVETFEICKFLSLESLQRCDCEIRYIIISICNKESLSDLLYDLSTKFHFLFECKSVWKDDFFIEYLFNCLLFRFDSSNLIRLDFFQKVMKIVNYTPQKICECINNNNLGNSSLDSFLNSKNLTDQCSPNENLISRLRVFSKEFLEVYSYPQPPGLLKYLHTINHNYYQLQSIGIFRRKFVENVLRIFDVFWIAISLKKTENLELIYEANLISSKQEILDNFIKEIPVIPSNSWPFRIPKYLKFLISSLEITEDNENNPNAFFSRFSLTKTSDFMLKSTKTDFISSFSSQIVISNELSYYVFISVFKKYGIVNAQANCYFNFQGKAIPSVVFAFSPAILLLLYSRIVDQKLELMNIEGIQELGLYITEYYISSPKDAAIFSSHPVFVINPSEIIKTIHNDLSIDFYFLSMPYVSISYSKGEFSNILKILKKYETGDSSSICEHSSNLFVPCDIKKVANMWKNGLLSPIELIMCHNLIKNRQFWRSNLLLPPISHINYNLMKVGYHNQSFNISDVFVLSPLCFTPISESTEICKSHQMISPELCTSFVNKTFQVYEAIPKKKQYGRFKFFSFEKPSTRMCDFSTNPQVEIFANRTSWIIKLHQNSKQIEDVSIQSPSLFDLKSISISSNGLFFIVNTISGIAYCFRVFYKNGMIDFVSSIGSTVLDSGYTSYIDGTNLLIISFNRNSILIQDLYHFHIVGRTKLSFIPKGMAIDESFGAICAYNSFCMEAYFFDGSFINRIELEHQVSKIEDIIDGVIFVKYINGTVNRISYLTKTK